MPNQLTPPQWPGNKPDVMGALKGAAKSVQEKLREMAKMVVPKITEMFKSAINYLKKAPEKLRGFLRDIKKPGKLFGQLFSPKNPEKNAGIMNRIMGALFSNMPKNPEKNTDKTNEVNPVQTQKEKKPKTDQEQLAEIMANVNNYEELYAKYKTGPDSSPIKKMLQKKLRSLALYSIHYKESDPWSPDVRSRLVNLKAINYNPKNPAKNNAYGKRLANEKVVPPVNFIKNSKSTTLFANGLGTIGQFKQTLMDKLQPNSKDSNEVRLKKAVMVLSCSALGAYQIVPIEHFKTDLVGRDGVPTAQQLYNYLKKPALQKKSYTKIIDNLGKKYDWNLTTMAVAYYSGESTANKVNSGRIKLSRLSAPQSHGYESTAAYAKGATTAATQKILEGKAG